ncbi:MAG TPA: toll/interleukin-1 receptor domain-containing protein [Woeseiaceae bacterium]
MAKNYKYKAFISYSHSDEKWASWLHKALEAYRPPKGLVGRETPYGPVPERFAPVFRDREELATATSLGDTLTQALEDSACQIVICSPRAAKSHWTNEEILTYKRLGRSHRIFALIVDGEPGASQNPDTADEECFPPALIYEMGDDGELTDVRSEPIAADARPGKDPKQAAKLKLLAGMLGVGFDDLRQRESQRRQRRMMVLTTAAFIGMAITSGLAVTAYLARLEAEEQRRIAEIEAETARQTTEFMVGLFEVSDPSEALGNTITAREILDKGAERIEVELDDQPEIQATLMDTMGTVYKSLGLYPEAVRLVDRSVEKRRGLFGNGHPEVALSLTHLGEVLALTADYERSEQSLREALETRRELHGDRSDQVAETLTHLGDVLHRQAKYDEARPLFEEALEIRRSLYEAPHPSIAESLEDLGLNDYEQGDYHQAVAYLEYALDMRRLLHGSRHPDLAQAISNLAWAIYDMGDLYKAETLMRESLAMKRALLEEVHPEIALEINNIARVAEMRGDIAEAEKLYREALSVSREIHGDMHPDIALVLGNLAFAVHAQGNKAEAINLARQSYEMFREIHGVGHSATAYSAASLGFWLVDESEFDEAEQLLQESLAVRREILGAEHPQTAGTMTVIAKLFLETERFDQALEIAREARQILLLSLPKEHWRVALARNYEGQALAGIGDYAAAEPELLASLEGLEQAPIPDLVSQSRARVAQFYLDWGRPQEAEKFE